MSKKSKVLVADHNPEVVRSISKILRSEGYEVAEAATERECLNVIISQRPEILLLDETIPHGSYTEFCKQLKRNHSRKLYIVLLAGQESNSDDYYQESTSGFIDELIKKPVHKRDLLIKLNTFERIKRSEYALELQHQWSNLAMAKVNDGVIATDIDGNITYMNPSSELLTGLKFSDVEGMEAENLILFKNRTNKESVKLDLLTVIKNGNEMRNTDLLLISKGGSEVCVDSKVMSIKNKNNDVIGGLIFLKDASALSGTMNDTSEEHILSNNFFKSILTNIQEVIYSMDGQFTLTYLSPKCNELYGYCVDDFKATKGLWRHCVHPEDYDLVDNEMFYNTFAGKPSKAEYRIITKDLKIKWVQERNIPTMDENGKLKRIDGSIVDITDRKLAEEALKESEIRLQNFYELLQM